MPTKLPSISRRHFLASAALIGSGFMLASPLQAEPTQQSISFLVLGDWGEDGADGQTEVALAMIETAKVMRPDFIISVGDNFYPRGVRSVSDKHWLKSFEQIYNSPEMRCPWYAVLGNHDIAGNIVAESMFHNVDKRWNMPSPYYVHIEQLTERVGVEFFFLNTTPLQLPDNNDGSAIEQIKWFEEQLKQSNSKWKIAIGHHPIYSSGRHGASSYFADRVRPLLERYGVQAYLCGHEHNLEHIKKHGVEYIVTGSGANTRFMNPLKVWLSGSDFTASKLGFAAITIGLEEMVIEYFDSTATKLFRSSIFAPS